MYKKNLYEMVDIWLKQEGIGIYDYPLDAIMLANKQPDLEVKFAKFENKNIGGMLIKDAKSSMCLNTNKRKVDINFDCMHELIHYKFHKKSAYNCVTSQTLIQQNSFIEWQANEGAAQALVPYQSFIPIYCNSLKNLKTGLLSYNDFFRFLANEYKVNELVIKFRIESLEYEILQYTQGIEIEKLQIASKKERQLLGYLPQLNKENLPYIYQKASFKLS